MNSSGFMTITCESESARRLAAIFRASLWRSEGRKRMVPSGEISYVS